MREQRRLFWVNLAEQVQPRDTVQPQEKCVRHRHSGEGFQRSKGRAVLLVGQPVLHAVNACYPALFGGSSKTPTLFRLSALAHLYLDPLNPAAIAVIFPERERHQAFTCSFGFL